MDTDGDRLADLPWHRPGHVPDWRDATVVGVDDADFGKRLCAYVVLVPGGRARQDAEEITLYVKNNLARHKVPRDVVFVDGLPRNATGKLLRRVLAEMDVDQP